MATRAWLQVLTVALIVRGEVVLITYTYTASLTVAFIVRGVVARVGAGVGGAAAASAAARVPQALSAISTVAAALAGGVLRTRAAVCPV